MPKNIFVTELVNAFNLNNYFSDNIYTNFAVQKGKGDKIVSLFERNGNIKEYLNQVREEIIRQHYGDEKEAGKFYNLNCFPFNGSFNRKRKRADKNIVVRLANLMDDGVIHNLKLHFANEFQDVVEAKIVGNLERKVGLTEEEALQCVRKSVQLEKTDKHSSYLYCISFSNRYFREKGYSLRLFEILKDMYVTTFDSRLEDCGLNDSSIFYEYRDNKLYIKDIADINVIRDIVRYVKMRIAFDFRTPGKEDSKVENFKNILSELIFKITGKFIEGYEYDVFTDEDEIKGGNSFALIPLVEVNDRLVPLSKEDIHKINEEFYTVLGDIVLSNIAGKTENTQFTTGRSIYAFSDKQIAQLLPVIMQSPITYNKEFGRFEFAVNFEKFGNQQRSFSPNSGSDGEDSPNSSLNGIDSPKLRSVKAKRDILWNFIRYLPLEKNEKSRAEIYSFLSSAEGTEKLYSILSSFCDRGGLYSKFCLSCKQRNEMEETWRLLHQFKELLSASSDRLEGLTLGGPRCRDSVASKDSEASTEDSAYYTESSTSLRSSVSSAESSDEGGFSRNALPYSSSISRSSTYSSVSSHASDDTIVAGDERDDTLCAGASCSKRGSTFRVDVSRYNEEHDPTVLYNEGKGIAKKFGIESAFEPDKYGQFRKNWERYGRDRAIKRLNEPPSEKREQRPSTDLRSIKVAILRVKQYHPPRGSC